MAWIQQAVGELRQLEPSAEAIKAAMAGQWDSGDYLIFSNGWARYQYHSAHCDDGMDDITVLHVPGGAYYLSKTHFCDGIRAETSRVSDGEKSQPADVNDFFSNRAAKQDWNLFSPDGALQCIVLNPHDDEYKKNKNLFVWIGTADKTPRTLFERRYRIASGPWLSWQTHWTSPDVVAVDVFEYLRSPMLEEELPPKQQIETLTFRRDTTTGVFIEQTQP
jgi:hypothetical protein